MIIGCSIFSENKAQNATSKNKKDPSLTGKKNSLQITNVSFFEINLFPFLGYKKMICLHYEAVSQGRDFSSYSENGSYQFLNQSLVLSHCCDTNRRWPSETQGFNQQIPY